MVTMLIEEGLMSYLLSVGDLQIYVGNRIYPSTLPQNPTYPAIVYQKISNIHIKSHQGSSGLARPILRFSCWASTYSQAKVLAELLRLALEGYRGRIGGDDGLNLYGSLSQNEYDEYSSQLDLYCVTLDYALWHDEEKPTGISAEPIATSMRGKFWVETIICTEGQTEFNWEYPFREKSLQIYIQRLPHFKDIDYTEKSNRKGIILNKPTKAGWLLIAAFTIDLTS